MIVLRIKHCTDEDSIPDINLLVRYGRRRFFIGCIVHAISLGVHTLQAGDDVHSKGSNLLEPGRLLVVLERMKMCLSSRSLVFY